MGKISDVDAREFLNSRFGGVSISAAASTYYVGLSTTAPTDAGGNITEPSGNAYARVAIDNDTTTWGAAATTGRSRTNAIAVVFPTATGSWGTITHFVVMDASTAGNMRAWGALTTPEPIVADNTPTFPVASLTVTAPGT